MSDKLERGEELCTSMDKKKSEKKMENVDPQNVRLSSFESPKGLQAHIGEVYCESFKIEKDPPSNNVGVYRSTLVENKQAKKERKKNNSNNRQMK